MATPQNHSKASIWRVLLPVFFVISLIILGLYAIKLQVPHSSKDSDIVEIRVGNMIPDFSLTQMDGTEVHLSDLKSKIYMINFWATWCDACMEEMPSIVQLRNTYSSKGFEVLGINLDENPDSVISKAAKQFHIEFPVFKDPDGKTAELFDVHAIPLTVMINNQRKILLVKDGGKNWNSPSVHSDIERWLSE